MDAKADAKSILKIVKKTESEGLVLPVDILDALGEVNKRLVKFKAEKAKFAPRISMKHLVAKAEGKRAKRAECYSALFFSKEDSTCVLRKGDRRIFTLEQTKDSFTFCIDLSVVGDDLVDEYVLSKKYQKEVFGKMYTLGDVLRILKRHKRGLEGEPKEVLDDMFEQLGVNYSKFIIELIYDFELACINSGFEIGQGTMFALVLDSIIYE